MDRLIIHLLGRLAVVWRRLGADPLQLLAILRAKLMADGRRTIFMGRQQVRTHGTWLTYAVMAITGLFIGILMLPFDYPATGLAVYFFAWLIFMLFTLISDFTDVLVDVRDNYVLLPRPVSDRTLTLARLLHILIYLAKLVFFFTLGAQLVLLLQYGFFDWLIFGLLLVLGLLMAIGLVSLIYLLVLRLTHPHRFRDIISFFQVGFSIFIFALYYLVPQLVDFAALRAFDVMSAPWALLFPNGWLAGLYQLLRYGDTRLLVLAHAALAVLIPSLLLVSSLRLAPAFARQLVGLGLAGSGAADSTADSALPAGKLPARRRSYHVFMAKWLTRPGLERQAFYWIYAMMARSRDFKLKTYPSFGLIPVLFIYFVFVANTRSLAEVQSHRYHLLLIYITSYGLIVPLTQGRYSEKFRAAWVFDAHPLARPGTLSYAHLMATAAQFFLPFYALLILMVLSVWGWRALPDLLIGLPALVLMGAIYQLLDKKLPFSQEQKSSQAGGNTAIAFLLMLVIGTVGGLHYLASGQWWLLLPFGLLLGGLAISAVWAVRE